MRDILLLAIHLLTTLVKKGGAYYLLATALQGHRSALAQVRPSMRKAKSSPASHRVWHVIYSRCVPALTAVTLSTFVVAAQTAPNVAARREAGGPSRREWFRFAHGLSGQRLRLHRPLKYGRPTPGCYQAVTNLSCFASTFGSPGLRLKRSVCWTHAVAFGEMELLKSWPLSRKRSGC